MSRSVVTCARARGRWIFTTTSSPGSSPSPRNRAVCTWATDAAASGCGSIEAKTSSIGRPSSAVIAASASAHGIGVESICSVDSASTRSRGSTSSREDSTCPSLTKVTPASFSAATRAEASSSSPPCRFWNAPSPWREAIARICAYRRARSRRRKASLMAATGLRTRCDGHRNSSVTMTTTTIAKIQPATSARKASAIGPLTVTLSSRSSTSVSRIAHVASGRHARKTISAVRDARIHPTCPSSRRRLTQAAATVKISAIRTNATQAHMRPVCQPTAAAAWSSSVATS